MLARQILLLLDPLHQPFFCPGHFQVGSSELLALGWLQTAILLITASCYSPIVVFIHAFSLFLPSSHKSFVYFMDLLSRSQLLTSLYFLFTFVLYFLFSVLCLCFSYFGLILQFFLKFLFYEI
jgi:hypothetical protein